MHSHDKYLAVKIDITSIPSMKIYSNIRVWQFFLLYIMVYMCEKNIFLMDDFECSKMLAYLQNNTSLLHKENILK